MMPLLTRLATTAVLLTGLLVGLFGTKLAVAAAANPTLALKRVVLSTGGVGYFEYQAKVTGDATLFLEVRRDRVDDVLKSLVVYDTGAVGPVTLPGREPLRERFSELPFGVEALDSPAALLAALRGAEVTVNGPHPLTGQLMAANEEHARLPGDGGTLSRHRLTLNTADGLRQAILEDIDSLRFTDAALQVQVRAALTALAQNGERERRTLTLHTLAPKEDAAERMVRIGYVIETPLWKTAYRLTLDDAGGDRAKLQGWAVLENLSGEDWNDVDLTVVSGNPVTFRQALYEPYLVNRPEIPVEVLGRVLPKVDQGTIPAGASPPPPLPPQAALAAEPSPHRAMARGLNLSGADGMSPVGASPVQTAALAAAEVAETATQVSFHYPSPVSVANGHSLLLPIVDRSLVVKRLALYQPATHPRHPLAVARVISARDDLSLPPGILTLYQRLSNGTIRYLGDARFPTLPSGETRLLTFAVDEKINIEKTEQVGQILTQVRIADGLLHATTTERATATYTVSGVGAEARELMIEHPRRAGWNLASGNPGIETTPDAYRLKLDVPAGKTAVATVVTERPRLERIELVTLAADRIQVYAQARDLPESLRAALTQIAEAQTALADRERRVTKLEHEQAEVIQDQQRLRDNLGAVGQGSDLSRRYLAKLGAQEDRLDAVIQELAQAQGAVSAARQALADRIRGLGP